MTPNATAGDAPSLSSGRGDDRPTLLLVEGFAGPKQLRHLLSAVLVIGSDLDLTTMLSRIVEAATELAGARYGALGVLDEARTELCEFITIGIDDAARARIGDLPRGHGILGTLITDPKPLRLPDLHEHPESHGFPPNHPPMTSFLGVPVLVRGEAFGNLYLCDRIDGDVFTDIDEELVVALAVAAGVAIDNARLLARAADVAMLEDRDRIARDLHDTVIQRLFTIGLGLQGVAHDTQDPTVGDRLESTVDEIDITIREIRSVIFELHTPRLPGRSIRQAIALMGAESARTLGFEPETHFTGPVDTAVDDQLAEHLLAVAREALTNVARHARATHASLTLAAGDGTVSLIVDDDGVGPPSTITAGRGVENMAARAQQLGGRCEITHGEPRGTVVRWCVPSH